MLDHGGDGRRCRPAARPRRPGRSGRPAALDQAQRDRRLEQSQGRIGFEADAHGERLERQRLLGKDVEQAEANAGEQHLRIDEAGDEIEDLRGASAREATHQRQARRLPLERRAREPAIANAQPALAPAHGCAGHDPVAERRRRRHWPSRQAAMRSRSACPCLRHQSLRLGGHEGAQLRSTAARRDGRRGAGHQPIEAADRLGHAELARHARPPERDVAAGRLADHLGVGRGVTDVVGHLVGLAEPVAEGAPRRRVAARRLRAGHRRRGEQRSGLGALVVGQIDLRLAFPGLAGDDAERHADAAADGLEDRRQALRRTGRGSREGLEGAHDQRIAGEDGKPLAVQAMHRRRAAPGGGVVERRQVVVHERGAVQAARSRRRRRRRARVGRRRRPARPQGTAAGGSAHRRKRPRAGPPVANAGGQPCFSPAATALSSAASIRRQQVLHPVSSVSFLVVVVFCQLE